LANKFKWGLLLLENVSYSTFWFIVYKHSFNDFFLNAMLSVDGKAPSLACGTTGGKILLHSPHEGNSELDGNLPALRYLNLNRKITSIAAGIFHFTP